MVRLEGGQARVMAKATEDPDLYAGASKQKTWLIETADGATVGDDNWYTVNVAGVDQAPETEPDPDDMVLMLSADSMEIDAGGMTTISVRRPTESSRLTTARSRLI